MEDKTVGLFVGKFLPLHRGHLTAIIQASTQVDMLYVVVSQDREFMKIRCEDHKIKEMPLETITMWLHKELQAFSSHIKIVPLDETGIPPYPVGWPQWAELARKVLISAGVKEGGWADKATNPIQIDYMFGSEKGYQEPAQMYFNSSVEYVEIDVDRRYVDISATQLVKDIFTHWDMLPGSVREHFVKKVLIVGTESCGKTTLVQKLAKYYLTSWSEEVGKYYQRDKLGDYGGSWEIQDFENIAIEQLRQDDHAYKTANKLSIIDTDAIVTSYYLNMYLNEESDLLKELSRKEINKWDLVIMLEPTVPFVQDGTRWEENREKRWELHDSLKKRYDDLGIRYITIGGNYHYRLNVAIRLIDDMLRGVE